MQSFLKSFFSLLLLLCLYQAPAPAQIDARMLRYPDVSATQITFVYAGDIWVAPKNGGVASKLSSPEGSENNPTFSPDGQFIAFTGNYDGNSDVYVVPVAGGTPKRLTYHGVTDNVQGWTPDGGQVLFTSSRYSGRQRYNQFFTIPVDGGMAEKLPVPYGEYGDFSPDGRQLVYTPRSRLSRTWKRYRGGSAADLTIFNLDSYASEVIAASDANDEAPMWRGRQIYFLSDRGPAKRFNLYVYNQDDKQVRQLTRFTDFDIHFPAMGPEEIVFEAGGKLYLFDLADESYDEVAIKVVTDQESLKPRTEKVKDLISEAWPSPDGRRVIVAARGELFNVPAEKGYVKNITASSGVAERYPAWSPDGRYLAYWSDRSGEYELMLRDLKAPEKEIQLTEYGPRFRYQPIWSPDSKKIAFIDNDLQLFIYDRDEETTTKVEAFPIWSNHYSLSNFSVSWSPDSRWLAYARQLSATANDAIFLYDYDARQLHQVTAGYYSDYRPVFDPDGKHLFFYTNRHFSPVYSDYDNGFVYPNATRLAVATLRDDLPNPLAPENDEAAFEEETDEEEKDAEEDEEKEAVAIDLERFEQRILLLPPRAGNFGNLQATKGKIAYQRYPNSGAEEEKRPILFFDLEEREEKTILDDADGFLITAKGEKMLVAHQGKHAIIDVAEGQKMDKLLPTDEMEMTVDPRAEWRQIFNDAWRFERDFFYDPNMHGVDWAAMRRQYGALIDVAVTRWDVNYVLGELIGELNASHTYRGGGDTERAKQRAVGYLGVDWKRDGAYYVIDRILEGAPWDAEARSPLAMPGIDAQAGDRVLAVNGNPLRTDREPDAAFEGLAGKTIELKLQRPGEDTTRTLIVETMPSETRLRHLIWIEHNRQYVEKASDGRIGYVYVRSTGIDGQNELVRQFQAQWRKDGLIIDERFNSGGQIPDRFIELLNRPLLAYWDVRVGESWNWPPVAHFGPKAMLINGWSGSGGDAFPDYFRKSNLGPLIGTRTWGGLIGISGSPALIDGGVVTVPTFRMYDPDGEWFREGYGVAPDIEVPENPTELANGKDPQIDRAVQEILQALDNPSYETPATPKPEVRSK